MKRLVAVIVVALAAAAGALVAFAPVQAASQGSGFGTWAPISAYGWHGSMVIAGVHTYCIRPGLPAPTGPSADHGVSGSAAGLSPTQLTGINLLVSKYGQTDDPVQAASVGWAVKAIADWNETLHAFGYGGDTLQGAINWTFSALAPESNSAVQQLATAYYAEATSVGAGTVGGSGGVTFTIDPDDESRGTVTATSDVGGVTGTLSLDGAVFADSGSAGREGATPGMAYEIVATPHDGIPFRVHGAGTFRGGYQAAVRHFTTDGGQDTAGPAGMTEFGVEGQDGADRMTTFAPVITTQVMSRYVAGGRFVDDVVFASARGAWPRTADGGYAPIAATGTVYRTMTEPVSGAVPADAERIAELAVATFPDVGPTVPYRVESPAELPGAGFYTAVWQIRGAAQSPETQRSLEPDYAWTEPFGEQSQITMLSTVSSHAEPVVAVGASMQDEITVEGVIPASGLDLTAAVFRAADGIAPAESCTPETLVWSNADAPIHITTPGRTIVTAPNVPDFGTYYWRERATDTEGRLVHEGPCGLESETTRAPVPTATTRAAASTGFGGILLDIATVTGPVPVTGRTVLTFELYRITDAVAPASACTPENLIFDTRAEPVAVTAAGEYASPGVRPREAGTFAWIERLWYTRDGETAARLLAEGECAVSEETIIVDLPAVSTIATERAATGEPFTDIAMVTGLAPDAEAQLVFFAYRNEHGAAPDCSAARLLAETPPVAVSGDGRYESPSVRSDVPGVVQWVAELRYPVVEGNGAPTDVILSRGECGEEQESTIVDTLAATGAASLPLLAVAGIGAGAAAVGIALAAAYALRARRTRR